MAQIKKNNRNLKVDRECEAREDPDTADGHLTGWCLMKQSV